MKENRFVKSLKFLTSKQRAVLVENDLTSIAKVARASYWSLLELPGFGPKSASSLKRFVGSDIDYPSMQEIPIQELADSVEIEAKRIRPWREVKKLGIIELQPKQFETEKTTVWSFPERGDWATHTPDYRGNWSPRVARNIILRYTKKGDTVLDPMVGGGTTLVEAALTGRNGIGIDINSASAAVTADRLAFLNDPKLDLPKSRQHVYVGDTRNLDLVGDESIDLIATHPPYANIIKYGKCSPADLSLISDFNVFAEEIGVAAREMFRVLRKDRYCAILIGDTHNHSHFVPISARVMMEFMGAGFILKEDVIKHEWNCQSNGRWSGKASSNFLLTMHEHLFVFRKLAASESKATFKNSSIDFLMVPSEKVVPQK